MIALLDGSQVDVGSGWEIGYFFARKSPEQKIIGIRTEFRRAGESEGAVVNAMIEGACDWIVRIREELVETISQFFWCGVPKAEIFHLILHDSGCRKARLIPICVQVSTKRS
jgi:hypothetical protein